MRLIADLFQRSTLCMIFLGIGTGVLFKVRFPISKIAEKLIEMAGDVLLNLLQMFAVPLIVTSVIAGVTDLNTSLSGKTAIYTLMYISGTTALAITLGMTLVLLIKPGGDTVKQTKWHVQDFSMHLVFLDIVRNLVPENFFQAFYEHYQTEVVEVDPIDNRIVFRSALISENDTELRMMGSYADGANMLGLIVWSFIFGILLNRVGPRAKVTVKAAKEINNAIKIIFKYMPIGIYFLMIEHVMEIKQWSALIKLGKVIMVVFMGFGIHSLIVLPLVYFIFTRKNPFVVFQQVDKALINALTMASSSATLPITLQCCEEKMKVDVRLCRLMLPIVSSINMNGMAIYEVIAAVFIAQISQIYLNAQLIISIGLTSAVASFGAVGVPMLGPASTILILTAVGLPARGVSILIAFEWFIDHFSTMVNVLSDCFGVAVISQMCKNELKEESNDIRVRSINQMQLDLLCLEPNDEINPPATPSPSTSISPSSVDHLSTISKPSS
ncbi:excitatory amino acid transporter 3-like isoform X2 [Poeciliopsis prolifica]|uniref:excitatory amino acid transporter 3-like isoform X2 n=1 Tax=Poeciliopsis prolifica TaxID=188132 RepID=UPI00241437AF|nr:excitatory amino acid transporter 3-like isoform X2 [Poeciliopsis prolifica]